jgi:uncharacterized protein YndB with AHSA1/START domain
MATVSTTIDLDATPATVWGALTTTDDYPTWNPFIRRLEGWLTPGSKLTVRIEPPGGKPMTFDDGHGKLPMGGHESAH